MVASSNKTHSPGRTQPNFLQVRRLLPALLLLLLGPPPCAGQPVGRDASASTSPPRNSAPSARTARPANALGLWLGGSVATGGPIGNISRARFGLLGVRYERLLVPAPSADARSSPSLTYTADLFPLLLLSIPQRAISSPPPRRPDPTQDLHTYGIGVSPAGLRLTFRAAQRVRPFVLGSTGLAYFAQAVPGPWGKHLNFMFDVGAGVRVALTPHLLFTAGYRYHHLSNGFRGRINPGIDGNLISVGVVLSR